MTALIKQATDMEIISIQIEAGLISLRGLSPKRLRFELEYGLERGSTDNSFLFTNFLDINQDKTAVLVHPPGAIYADVFLPAIQDTLPNPKTKLQIIVGHINPNRVDLLKLLAENYSDIELITSNPGSKLIKDIWEREKPLSNKKETDHKSSITKLPAINIIRQEQELELSMGYKLKLIPAPTPRWPGGLIAFEEKLGLLMSDKFFAAHICTNEWAERNRISTEEERRHFYDCLMAPMENQVDFIIERLSELDINTIAPCHGPAIETSWRSLLNDYRQWGLARQHYFLKVVLIFASAYGNTAAIADAIANGISRTGVKVESFNCEFDSTNELIQAIKKADGYLIGSPTLGGHAPTPIVSALGTLLAEGDRSKQVGIFGSYGWSGEAIDLLENKLRDGGFKFGFDPIKIKFSPDRAMVKKLEETGTLFGRNLQQAQKRQQRRASGGMNISRSDPGVLALGRIIGSLCILTARKEIDKEIISSAMVASWISQASFSPPGITIAVAKDRAVETLLHCGDHFALNILASNRHNKLMRQFLQPFSPGADRFHNVKIDKSPHNQPILPESLAWLEGCVEQRMECGDHWLIYAVLNNGKVLDKDGVTAVHHRRTGANY